MKARSRLKTVPDISPPSSPSLYTPAAIFNTPLVTKNEQMTGFFHNLSQVDLKPHLRRLPTLIISLLLFGLLQFVLTRIPPTRLQNFILPNWYIPFQILFFTANWFFFSFLFLHSRRGFMVASFLQTFLILNLWQVSWDWQIAVGILIFFVIIELLATRVAQVNNEQAKPHANFHQKSFHHRRRTPARSVLFPAR